MDFIDSGASYHMIGMPTLFASYHMVLVGIKCVLKMVHTFLWLVMVIFMSHPSYLNA